MQFCLPNISHKLRHLKSRKLRDVNRRNMPPLFSICSLRGDCMITSKPTWKLKHTNSIYSRVFCTFLPNVIKIDPYDFELYRFKVGAFFETPCIYQRQLNASTPLKRLRSFTDDTFRQVSVMTSLTCRQPWVGVGFWSQCRFFGIMV